MDVVKKDNNLGETANAVIEEAKDSTKENVESVNAGSDEDVDLDISITKENVCSLCPSIVSVNRYIMDEDYSKGNNTVGIVALIVAIVCFVIAFIKIKNYMPQEHASRTCLKMHIYNYSRKTTLTKCCVWNLTRPGLAYIFPCIFPRLIPFNN